MTSADWLNSPDPAQREVEHERLRDIADLRILLARRSVTALDLIKEAQDTLHLLVGDAVADSTIQLTYVGDDLDHNLSTAARALRTVAAILRQLPAPGQDDD